LIINIKKKRNGGDLIPKLRPIPELETIFKEHWNHARHCENERLWFNNIYAVVVAAILVFIGQAGYNQQTDLGPMLLLALFGLILSVLGFLVVIALTLGYAHHIMDIVMIFYYWDAMEFYRHPKKPVHFMDAHRCFYEITIALFAVLLLFYLSQAWDAIALFHKHWILLIAFALIFAVIEGLYRLRWKEHFSKCWRFINALQNDFEAKYRDNWPEWFRNPKYSDSQEKIVEIS